MKLKQMFPKKSAKGKLKILLVLCSMLFVQNSFGQDDGLAELFLSEIEEMEKYDEAMKNIQIPVKNGITIDMVRVKSGRLVMGATREMGSRFNSEIPRHEVAITENFYIGKYEVTQALWKAVMGTNPSFFKGDNLPVENVSWNECKAFITKLNRLTGKRFRLPTEAEWEYAAYGGPENQGYMFSGGNDQTKVACYVGNSNGKTKPVGSKQPNELGIYDMSGNVAEWCQDWFGKYTSGLKTNPKGPSSGTLKIYRGGSYKSDAWYVNCIYRSKANTNTKQNSIGFRLALNE